MFLVGWLQIVLGGCGWFQVVSGGFEWFWVDCCFSSYVADSSIILTTENSEVLSARSLVVDEMPSARSLM